MSKGNWVTPEIVQRVKEINDDHPGIFHHEIAKRVGVSDSTIRRILHNDYFIDGDKVVRIYRHSKKAVDPEPEKNMLHMYPEQSLNTKTLLNALYGSKSFQVTLNDIYNELKQIREVLSDLRNLLKWPEGGEMTRDEERAVDALINSSQKEFYD